MPKLSPEAQARQAQLTRKFIASLPEKRARIELCWKEVQDSQWSPETQVQLRTMAHHLTGSAGSYGLEELGALALRLDTTLESGAGSRDQRHKIYQQTADLVRALAEVTN